LKTYLPTDAKEEETDRLENKLENDQEVAPLNSGVEKSKLTKW